MLILGRLKSQSLAHRELGQFPLTLLLSQPVLILPDLPMALKRQALAERWCPALFPEWWKGSSILELSKARGKEDGEGSRDKNKEGIQKTGGSGREGRRREERKSEGGERGEEGEGG